METDYFIKIRQLEEAINFIENQNSALLKTISNQIFELETLENNLETEKYKNEDLAEEIESTKTLLQKTRHLEFEITKTQKEKEFHSIQHAETKKKIHTKTNQEFQINSIKKELISKINEVESLKKKIDEYKNEIEQLFVYSEKPKNNNKGEIEGYYAKKILNLEEAIHKISGEVNDLEKTKRTETGLNLLNENTSNLKQLMIENETLRVKVEEAKKENASLKNELEELRNDNMGKSEIKGKPNFQSHVQQYVKEIEKLKEENEKLAASKGGPKTGESMNPEAMFTLNKLNTEKRILSQKLDDLVLLRMKIFLFILII